MSPLTYVEEPKRQAVWLRAFMMGPSGSGKSLGALRLADAIFGGGKLPITLINSEQRDSGNPYGDRFKLHGFIDLAEDGDFSPEAYIKALDLAERKNPGGVTVLDSASHEWMGPGGVLSLADRFGDWKVVRPRHNAFVARLMAFNGHLIVTCRAKMKYEVGEEEIGGRKRQVINMLGVGPIQSDDLQYEFNLVGRFEQGSHDVAWSGHVDPLTDTVSNFGDAEQSKAVADALTGWLAEGNPLPEPPTGATDAAVTKLVKLLTDEGIAIETVNRGIDSARVMGVIPAEWVKIKTDEAKKRAEAKKASGPASDDVAEPEGAAESPSAGPEASGDASPPGDGESAEAASSEAAEAAAGDPLTEEEEAEIERLWTESGGEQPQPE